ncbi:3' terminal RNA ribose 2'-O-methyltransferase Hen1 [Actinoallomurus iriomotensis]|uniref:Small RNA 2'-O-methyltransferase n=1 Tax=Actinoallomurus iriomotensis TaxID=478107 RepID=A0A9W6SDH7_9ACTN|nr:3' terminal RNA ribose 2'-O-methyltransferase Hen1 [Actinoallomurus iriomotensis]GLY90677.1 3' terminal RNA ribose 2'-O-methyltransferase Hen1 [Actinoallomurus iriomotensis]
MLLTITTTARPATDLGYLLVKHPGRVQAFEQSFGTAHVFYPEADEDRCTAALLLDVDPIKLARTRRTPDLSLGQYVNDRPYAASSLLASAMANVFRTAMRGQSRERPELAGAPIPLRITLPALPCRGGPELAASLFAPLGWRVEACPVPLDEGFPEWGDSRYVTLTIEGESTLAAALNQLYVLLPVLDDSKHYWVAADEVDKLVRAGEGWLAAHPARARITRRYLANRHRLVRTALARLADADDAPDDALDRHPIDEEPPVADPTAAEPGSAEPAEDVAAPPVPLAERRVQAVLDALRAEHAATVIDLGCGAGRLLSRLLQEPFFESVAGTDVSARAIEAAQRRLAPGLLPRAQADRLNLFTAALTYADQRFHGYDAAVLMEVIEHVDPPRLPAVERVVFGDAAPRVVIVTTPNAEYNVRYENLTGFRHPDHRFEWTRAEFDAWTARVAGTYGYRVRHVPVGDDDPSVGAPTQMGVFVR